MKVKCIATKLDSEQKKLMGINIADDPQYPFVEGETYHVLGLTSTTKFYTMLLIPMRYIIPAPLCLFEIIDDRPSSYWKAKKLTDYELSLWPELLYQEYFFDDLSDGEPSVVKLYNDIVKHIEREFS